MTCQDLNELITPFIDGQCTDAERTAIMAHLDQCEDCHARVEVESTAKHLLHAHAAVARTMGVAPSWRPRVFRLGQPTVPVHPTVLLLVGLIGVGLVITWLRPAPVLAVGVIGDSYCEHVHRFTTRFNVDERECTLGCVERGAEFVLVTDTQIYRIRDQQLPELVAFANQRVKVEGRMDGDRMVVTRMSAADGGSDAAARPAK